MSDIVIRVDNLSKLYHLGELHKQTNSFRDRVTQAFTGLFQKGKHKALNPGPDVHPACPVVGKHRTGVKSGSHFTGAPCLPRGIPDESGLFHWGSMPQASNPMLRAPCSLPSSQSDDHIWALKDVSFEVKQGEVLGIIGSNGAGKSTLLKILSRITKPTEGNAWINGRVGSLLEVGTGFHPELTGRENIYLNAAILGMRKVQIARKFDEIVDFAEIEKFMDTPVKRYSSGMYVRLAFAVAAHLEPEILLVDEVLAVGDATFQKKCLGKMRDVAKEGRTVLFVSHNMVAIKRLCRRAILLDEGQVSLDSTADAAVSSYLAEIMDHRTQGSCSFNLSDAPGDDYARLKSVQLTTQAGVPSARFSIEEGFVAEIEFVVLRRIPNFHVYIRVFTEDGIIAFGSGDWDSSGPEEALSRELISGRYRARCLIPGHLLNRGKYTLAVIGHIPQERYVFNEENLVEWEINEKGGAGGTTSLLRPGVFRPQLKWEFARVGDQRNPGDTAGGMY